MRYDAGRVIAGFRRWLSQPGRRRQLLAAGAAAAALLGAFQLGQMRAGYNVLQAQLAQRRLSGEVRKLRVDNRQVTGQLTRLQTDELVNRESYAQVEQQLAELQDKLIEQQEELAFYRGIVGGAARGGLRVQDFALSPVSTGAVRLRFVLAQAESAERDVRGQLQVRLEGLRAGGVVSLDVAALSAPQNGLLPDFAFRYFQEISAELRVPADFTPERVVIRIVPATRGFKGSVESFPWAVSGG